MQEKDDIMFKTFIAGLTAISLTMTTVGPVQAQGLNEEQVGKVLFGVLATAVIATAISKQRDKDRAEPVEVHGSRTWAPRPRNPRVEHPRQPRGQWGERGERGERDRMSLPAECFVSYQTRYGQVRMFGRDCMRRNYRNVGLLPAACSVRAATREGPRNGWDPQCLRVAGYRIDRRR